MSKTQQIQSNRGLHHNYRPHHRCHPCPHIRRKRTRPRVTENSGFLNRSWVIRLLPVVLDGRSVPIDVGRSKRLATVHQRRALEAIHPTCAIPDCEVIFDHCNVHHIDYWENGGATDLNNMIPLCSRHHHAAHEGGWKLQLDSETRELTIR